MSASEVNSNLSTVTYYNILSGEPKENDSAITHVICEILSHLNLDDLKSFSLTCNSFRKLVNERLPWGNVAKKMGFFLDRNSKFTPIRQVGNFYHASLKLYVSNMAECSKHYVEKVNVENGRATFSETFGLGLPEDNIKKFLGDDNYMCPLARALTEGHYFPGDLIKNYINAHGDINVTFDGTTTSCFLFRLYFSEHEDWRFKVIENGDAVRNRMTLFQQVLENGFDISSKGFYPYAKRYEAGCFFDANPLHAVIFWYTNLEEENQKFVENACLAVIEKMISMKVEINGVAINSSVDPDEWSPGITLFPPMDITKIPPKGDIKRYPVTPLDLAIRGSFMSAASCLLDHGATSEFIFDQGKDNILFRVHLIMWRAAARARLFAELPGSF